MYIIMYGTTSTRTSTPLALHAHLSSYEHRFGRFLWSVRFVNTQS